MAGTGKAPKAQTQRPRDAKRRMRGDWKPTEGVGWQHSKTPPKAPEGLKPESVTAWKTWMGSWFASHWTPEDLPGLLVVIALYDEVQRGEFQRATELRLQMDTYGISPKGQQDRRWSPPERPEVAPKAADAPDSGPYGHLQAVE